MNEHNPAYLFLGLALGLLSTCAIVVIEAYRAGLVGPRRRFQVLSHVMWVEPFDQREGRGCPPVFCCVSKETAIGVQCRTAHVSGYGYADEQQALDDFMAIRWAIEYP